SFYTLLSFFPFSTLFPYTTLFRSFLLEFFFYQSFSKGLFLFNKKCGFVRYLLSNFILKLHLAFIWPYLEVLYLAKCGGFFRGIHDRTVYINAIFTIRIGSRYYRPDRYFFEWTYHNRFRTLWN